MLVNEFLGEDCSCDDEVIHLAELTEPFPIFVPAPCCPSTSLSSGVPFPTLAFRSPVISRRSFLLHFCKNPLVVRKNRLCSLHSHRWSGSMHVSTSVSYTLNKILLL